MRSCTHRISSIPLMSGMRSSVITRSKLRSDSIWDASSPFAAVETSYSFASDPLMNWRWPASSSTTRMLNFIDPPESDYR